MRDKRCLIAVDLDDTTLDNLYELNDITTKVLKQLSKLGHKVMIATARPTSLTLPHYERLELDTLAALCNGADLVANLADKHQTLRKQYMPSCDLKKIFDAIPLDIIDDLGIERNDILYMYGDMKGFLYFEELIKQSNVEYIDIKSIPSVDAGRVFFRLKNTPDAIESINRLKDIESINVYYKKMRWDREQVYVNIRSMLADKWYSVKEAADCYGIDRENIIAFGDEYNDSMMLKNAGFGFAMLNGSEELKQDIGRITQYSHADGGVGRELARMFDLKCV